MTAPAMEMAYPALLPTTMPVRIAAPPTIMSTSPWPRPPPRGAAGAAFAAAGSTCRTPTVALASVGPEATTESGAETSTASVLAEGPWARRGAAARTSSPLKDRRVRSERTERCMVVVAGVRGAKYRCPISRRWRRRRAKSSLGRAHPANFGPWFTDASVSLHHASHETNNGLPMYARR